MTGMFGKALAGCALLALFSAPANAEEYRLAPLAESNWIAHFEQNCRLARQFGDADDPTMLIFTQYYPSEGVFLTVAGGPVSRMARSRKINVRFAPAWSKPLELDHKAAEFGDWGSAIFLRIPTSEPTESENEDEPPSYEVEGLYAIDVEAAGSIERLELSSRRHSISLELPGIADAFDILNQCSQNLVSYWGLDLEAHRTMVRVPEPINFDEIKKDIMSVYPRDALDRGEQATLNLRIIVDADGSIEECVLTDVTVTNALESPACDVFGNRAMFVPGEDEAGEPMRSYYTKNIVYTMRRR